MEEFSGTFVDLGGTYCVRVRVRVKVRVDSFRAVVERVKVTWEKKGKGQGDRNGEIGDRTGWGV